MKTNLIGPPQGGKSEILKQIGDFRDESAINRQTTRLEKIKDIARS